MQFPWKRHICQGGSIAKNVFLDSLSVCAKFQVGNKKYTIQPKFRAMPPDYNKVSFLLRFFASDKQDLQNWRNFAASTIFCTV